MFKTTLKLSIALMLSLVFSCKQESKKQVNAFAPKVVEAKGYIVPKDSLLEPVVTPINESKLKKVKAGVPKVVPTNLNVHVAGKRKEVVAGIPKICKLGTDSFPFPEMTPVHGKRTLAGRPEIILAKEPSAKDINPANVSFYKTRQGLKHNTVRSLLQDRYGNLWFGTNGGVSKYDGNSFTNFSEKEGLPHNLIYSILQDKVGNIWFATYGGGVCVYDGTSFTTFTENEGLPNNNVYAIFEDKIGNLWFATYGGICRYDGNRIKAIEQGDPTALRNQQDLKKENGKFVQCFTTFTEKQGLLNNTVVCIIQDKSGKLWFGTNQGVSRYDGKSFTNFTEKEGLLNNIVLCISEDRFGNIWFGTDAGICYYTGNRIESTAAKRVVKSGAGYKNETPSKSFINFEGNEGVSNNAILKILEDTDGNLWLGTFGAGLYKYDGESFTNFTESDGFSSNFFWSMLEDKSGNLWFGTDNGGVCRYDGRFFRSFTVKEGLGTNIVLRMAEDKSQNVWFATNGGGVSNYNGKAFSTLTQNEGLSSNIVFDVLKDRSGILWFATNSGGVCRFDGVTFTQFTEKDGLSSNVVLKILEDRHRNLWFGTFGEGVCKYDGKSFTRYSTEQGLANSIVSCIAEDKDGNLWFGGGISGGGVCRFNPGVTGSSEKQNKNGSQKHSMARTTNNNLFVHFNENQGLINNFVNDIIEDRNGNLWFATEGGVCRYDGKTFIHFTEKDGLINNNVASIAQDADGTIWFGTKKGLSKITANKLNNLSLALKAGIPYNGIKEGLFFNFGYNDGFLGLTCRRSSVLVDSKGSIWWGADVLTHYAPNYSTDTTAPVVNVTSVKLFGEEIDWYNLCSILNDSTGNAFVKNVSKDTLLSNGILLRNIEFDGITKWNNLPVNLSVPYNNNNFTFSFVGVHIQSRNHIKYQYKLEGFDTDWSSITDNSQAPYGNLPSGNFVFKVKAMNQSGVWSEPFEFKFEVRPPWWQTWWFRTLVGIIIIGSIIFYIKLRERKLKAEKEILEQTVIERTKEVVEEKRIVEEQKFVVEEQKHLIEEKHKEITDSINYAERIQRSFIATKELLDSNLAEYFVLFKPKDVVSGDFYWAASLSSPWEGVAPGRDGGGYFILATADSTGHGVPGAIMSLLNITSLEKAIEHHTDPAEILNATRKTIIERLKKDGSAEGGKDGMDCSLLCFDFENKVLKMAAANNPVWIVRREEDDTKELLEIKPDKMPVGKHDKDQQPFTSHTIQLQKDDVVYTLTDGFPDQFGGDNGKKFMSKKLKELLVANSHLPMNEQKQLLETTFQNWVRYLEQVDDVTVIGIRV